MAQFKLSSLLTRMALTAGSRYFSCPIEACKSNVESDSKYDGVIIVAGSIYDTGRYMDELIKQSKIDDSLEREGGIMASSSAAGRIIFSPTGSMNKDYSDARSFTESTEWAIKRAVAAGMKRPILFLPPHSKDYPYSNLICTLGALHALYTPLEVREAFPERPLKLELLGLECCESESVRNLAEILERGRIAGRDIGGSDPERMAAPRVEDYVTELFKNSSVTVEVVSDIDTLKKEYPLFAAVNQCANGIPRHRGRIIYLRYAGSGPIEKTLYLVGKGVTYDTGGADVKAGGHMAGMHRDKCGAAAVAAFLKIVDGLKPTNVVVVGAMCLVRNSIGSDAYVADEIITSRAGMRIRIGNTDAEGRMAMTDALCKLKEEALTAVNPQLMTVATLTGHALKAIGEPYSIILNNGPARRLKIAEQVQEAGNDIGDLFEISTIRREDYNAHKGKSEYEDVLQCNNDPSTQTPRGHQSPAAFMIMASGLIKHGVDGRHPLPYSHLEIAASSGPYPGIPTSTPVLALTRYYLPQFF